jgi:tight adherence protein C
MDMTAALAVGSVLLGVAALAARRDGAVARQIQGLAGRSEEPDRPPRDVLAAIGRTSLGRLAGAGDRMPRLLNLAGSPWSVEEMAGLRLILVPSSAVTGWLVAPGFLSWVAGAVFGAAGFFAPTFLMVRKGRSRQRSIELRVPDLVEVLVATAEAGLAPAMALTRAPAVLHGPLADEIEVVSGEIELGVPWRDALQHLVDRTDVPSLRRLVAALTRSSRLGSTVRTALRGVADDLRSTRRVRAEEVARRAPVKMLFPLVFLILPAFLLLTVGPAVLATLRSLQSGG